MKKLVYVTGAGRGIGRAIALKLIAEGYEVTGCSRTLKELEEAKKLSGGALNIASVDVTNESALQKWFDSEEKRGIPWGLVTAAGIYGPIGLFVENSWDQWKESIDINLYGTALACRIFAKKLMAKKESGRIVILSGGGATQPMPRFSSYCASKAAVVRFGETLAYELRDFGITVNSIAPGAVNTKLTEQLIEAGPEKAGKEMYDKAVKQKEEGGANPEKAGELAAYFMSEKAQNVTAKLVSAIWDPWSELHTKGEDFYKTELYTLRRVSK